MTPELERDVLVCALAVAAQKKSEYDNIDIEVGVVVDCRVDWTTRCERLRKAIAALDRFGTSTEPHFSYVTAGAGQGVKKP